ncbi:hypothetical protein EDB84DRAFT_1674369 [Lactarius hengduanensis]|nr:hypothetical protein EDB84DRAFT_1674369 [Lactarius hengduanensis]
MVVLIRVARPSPLSLLSTLILTLLLSFLTTSPVFAMPALIPVHNTLGALFIGTVLSSIIYGVTWLQVYSYYSSHSSRDRWQFKSFVAFLMLVDSANVVFVIHTSYHVGITNFGDYRSLPLVSWSLPVRLCCDARLVLKLTKANITLKAVALSAVVLEVSVQHFYAYKIYLLSRRSPYLPAAISVVSLTAFGIGIVFGANILKHMHELGKPFRARLLLVWAAMSNCHSYQNLCIATLFCDVVCDVLITFGMVYNLLSNRTQVRRTNEVLNLLAIYAINCGTLTLVFAISSGISLVKYPDALIYTPSFFIMIRLYFCAFMSILNSRDNLRETLDRQEGIVITLSKAHTGTTIPCDVQDTTETTTNKDVPESPSPVSVSSDTFSDGVTTFDRGKYPVSPVPGVLMV